MDGQLRIERMYAWVCLDEDGTEGVPAVTAENGLTLPLVGADMDRMDSLRELAQGLANSTGTTMTLCLFEQRSELETIGPEQ